MDNTQSIIDIKERFNNEIVDYVEYITSKNDLDYKRNYTINILKECIQKKYKNWDVFLFGSVTQGISTVFSDLDFEIISEEYKNFKIESKDRDEINLKQILAIIRDDFDARIIPANVPIIKAKCKKTDIFLDISVNRTNGYEDSQIIGEIISKHIILKQAL